MNPVILGLTDRLHGDEKLMKAKPEPFSEIVQPLVLEYTVHGTVDRDGHVNITEVTLADSGIDLWLDYDGTWVGDQVQAACDAIVARRNSPSIENEEQE